MSIWPRLDISVCCTMLPLPNGRIRLNTASAQPFSYIFFSDCGTQWLGSICYKLRLNTASAQPFSYLFLATAEHNG